MNTLYIYGAIGEEWDGLTDRQIAAQLDEFGDGPLTVRINSPGGVAYEGLAIYNLLKEREPNVIVDGLAASAASVIAMAGKDITMSTGSNMMIHDAWGLAIGNAVEMRQMADTLDTLSDSLAEVYAERMGDHEQARELMRAETWFNAQGAVDAGFASSVAGKSEKPPKNAVEILAAMGCKGFSALQTKVDDAKAEELAKYVKQRAARLYKAERAAKCKP